jgi:hypothetical protein
MLNAQLALYRLYMYNRKEMLSFEYYLRMLAIESSTF